MITGLALGLLGSVPAELKSLMLTWSQPCCLILHNDVDIEHFLCYKCLFTYGLECKRK